MTITRNMVERELLALPRQRTNHRGELGCVYTDAAGQHCIAGQVLANLGVKVPGHGEPGNVQTGIKALIANLHLSVEPDAVSLLHRAQGLADGAPDQLSTHAVDPRAWGDVVDELLSSKAKAAPWNTHYMFVNPPQPKLTDFWVNPPPPAPFKVPHDAHAPSVVWPNTYVAPLESLKPKPADPHTLSTKAVEEYAGVPEPTLRRWRDQGIIDHIHYPTTTQWAPETARIARVLARLPKLSPELYLKVAEKLRSCSSNWRDTLLVISGDTAQQDVRICFDWNLVREVKGRGGQHVIVLDLDKL